jgi:chromosome segregation ATPase
MKKIKQNNLITLFSKGAAVAALSLWFIACDNPNNRETATERELEEESAEARGNARDAANEVEKAGESAANDLERAGERAGGELKEERDEFITGTRKTMSDLDRRIEELRGKIDRAGGQAKSGMKEELNELEVKRKGLDTQLDKVENASESAWQDIKAGVKEAASDVEKAFDRAEDKFDRNYKRDRS